MLKKQDNNLPISPRTSEIGDYYIERFEALESISPEAFKAQYGEDTWNSFRSADERMNALDEPQLRHVMEQLEGVQTFEGRARTSTDDDHEYWLYCGNARQSPGEHREVSLCFVLDRRRTLPEGVSVFLESEFGDRVQGEYNPSLGYTFGPLENDKVYKFHFEKQP